MSIFLTHITFKSFIFTLKNIKAIDTQSFLKIK